MSRTSFTGPCSGSNVMDQSSVPGSVSVSVAVAGSVSRDCTSGSYSAASITGSIAEVFERSTAYDEFYIGPIPHNKFIVGTGGCCPPKFFTFGSDNPVVGSYSISYTPCPGYGSPPGGPFPLTCEVQIGADVVSGEPWAGNYKITAVVTAVTAGDFGTFTIPGLTWDELLGSHELSLPAPSTSWATVTVTIAIS